MNVYKYIDNLIEYTRKNRISVYEYFYKLGEECRKAKKVNVTGFELENPFLAEDDYNRLLNSEDDRIIEYFAVAMNKVIELNLEKKQENINNEKPKKKDNPVTADKKGNKESQTSEKKKVENKKAKKNRKSKKKKKLKKRKKLKLISKIKNKAKQIKNKIKTAWKNRKNRTKTRLIDRIKNKFKRKKKSSKVNVPTPNLENKVKPAKKTTQEQPPVSAEKQPLQSKAIVNPGCKTMVPYNNSQALLTRENHENIQEHELSKEEIKKSIVEQYSQLEPSNERINIPLLDELIINNMDEVAVLRDSQNKKVDLYVQQAAHPNIKRKRSYNIDEIKAPEGIYVNYQEYMQEIIDKVANEYPELENAKLVDKDNNERNYGEVVESMFSKLREAGTIKLGKEYAYSEINSYHDLNNIVISSSKMEIAGIQINKGIYVQKDLLIKLLGEYRITGTKKEINSNDIQKQNKK